MVHSVGNVRNVMFLFEMVIKKQVVCYRIVLLVEIGVLVVQKFVICTRNRVVLGNFIENIGLCSNGIKITS